jgi:hypothetical protein
MSTPSPTRSAIHEGIAWPVVFPIWAPPAGIETLGFAKIAADLLAGEALPRILV